MMKRNDKFVYIIGITEKTYRNNENDTIKKYR